MKTKVVYKNSLMFLSYAYIDLVKLYQCINGTKDINKVEKEMPGTHLFSRRHAGGVFLSFSRV